MKKRLLCTILILVMMFGATVSSYADPWTSEQAYQTTQGVRSLVSLVTSIYQLMQTTYGSSGDLALLGENVAKLVSWLVPEGYMPSDYHTLWELVTDIGTNLYTYLPHIPTIAGYVGSWMTSNNNYLQELNLGLTNYRFGSTGTSAYSWQQVAKNGHGQLFTGTVGQPMNGVYTFRQLYANGLGENQSNALQWQYGSPIGNVALMFQRYNANWVAGYLANQKAFLTDYNANLGVWEFDTLTQTAWTPTSVANGLYHYLAYVQRDVARLTYVLANQQDIDTRESIKQSGIEDLKTQLYDQENGGMQLDDMTDTLGLGSDAKSAFDLGSVDKGNAFSFTDDEGWGFWSKAVENDMLNIPQTRMLKNNIQEPETPLYDEKMQAFWEGIGIKDGE